MLIPKKIYERPFLSPTQAHRTQKVNDLIYLQYFQSKSYPSSNLSLYISNNIIWSVRESTLKVI